MKIRPFMLRGVWAIVALAVAALLWECLSRGIANQRLAPNWEHLVTESFPSFALFGDELEETYAAAAKTLAFHAWRSFERSMIGLAVGGAVGIAAGLFIHNMTVGRAAGTLLLRAVKSIPLFSLVVLFIYWYSGSEWGVLLYVSTTVALILATTTFEAASAVDRTLLWQAWLAGASRLGVLRTVILPAVIPQVLLALRWVVGLNWAFTLGAEYVSSRSTGLGALAYQSYLYSDVGKQIVLALIYGILGTVTLFAFDGLIRLAGSFSVVFSQQFDTQSRSLR